MDRSDERLKELMKALADTIGAVVNGNDEIRNAIAMIEREGYSVDMIVASITSMPGEKERVLSDADDEIEISAFDRSFLRKIHIRL